MRCASSSSRTPDSQEQCRAQSLFAYTYRQSVAVPGVCKVRSLEGRALANLKCHFGGLAIVIPELAAVPVGGPASSANPKASDYDVDAARKASYQTAAELAYDRYGIGTTSQSGKEQPASNTNKTQTALMKARGKIFDTLKASPEIAEVSDLYPDRRYQGSVVLGAFAPIFFVYKSPDKIPPQREAERAPVKRFYFVYNGRFLIAAGFCEPDMGMPALGEIVSEACLLLSKSGYEFRRLPPIPTLQSLDLGGSSAGSLPTGGVLNDSLGRQGTATSLFMAMPRNVQGSLRSLYSASFQNMIALYALKEESDTQEALFQTIEAQRETVLDLTHEFSQTRERQFLRRRKLRKLIRVHCLELTEKIGRADIISDSLTQGIRSLEKGLQQERELMIMLNREPGWKSYLHNDFDTKSVLDMITRTNDAMSRRDLGLVIVVVTSLAAAAGALVGALISRIL